MLGEATSQSPKLLLKKEKAPKSRGKALTFKQKKEIRECFELLEHEEPGFMYPEEFFKSMHALGFTPKDDEADTLFARVDVDGNGKIDLDEFTTLMSGYIQDSEMKEHKQLAELLSKIEGEERLSQVEKLKATAKKMGEHLDEAEIKNLLYGGIDGKGTLAPGFEVDALFDTLYSSTEPLALRTWQLGERAKERVTAEERERKYGIH
eukprot:CAMPEP_0114236124 /NCGR_PEP_ID=MMETSP0058-20121206/6654_1 /TAXON_ID=36894 /ORGANISM="Pyramimonas parkeae, CCMP726" /LENGTH=206 /DNA_ID=CAMNT_0001348007 /DNA_START=477 /DNA_END=1097 /DNA_ORIENTATION=-